MKVKLGDLVGVWDGTHTTKMRVVKVNRTTFECQEIERSHRPGRLWKVHVNSQYCIYRSCGVLSDWQNSY